MTAVAVVAVVAVVEAVAVQTVTAIIDFILAKVLVDFKGQLLVCDLDLPDKIFSPYIEALVVVLHFTYFLKYLSFFLLFFLSSFSLYSFPRKTNHLIKNKHLVIQIS